MSDSYIAWEALGPFPIGTREDLAPAPFLQHSAFEDLEYDPAQPFSSAIAPGGHVFFRRITQASEAHAVVFDYRGLKDWTFDALSSGWASYQHVTFLRRRFFVSGHQAGAHLVSLSSALEFSIDDRMYKGDIYNDQTCPEVAAHHLELSEGWHTVVVKAVYEIRLFGRPEPSLGPVTQFHFRVQSCSSLSPLLLCPDDAYLPSYIDGWVAGHGVSVAVRNLALYSITLLKAQIATSEGLVVSESSQLGRALHPGQNLLLPLRIKQRRPGRMTSLTVSVHFAPTNDTSFRTFEVSCTLRLGERHRGQPYSFTYLDRDGTYQRAIARAPKDHGRVVPPILALHGAGVKLALDDEFSLAIPQQAHAWVVWPTGLRSWGFDWHGSTLQSALSAVQELAEFAHGGSFAALPQPCIETSKLFVMGHSNGGQGAMFLMERYPDLTYGGVCASGWRKIQSYVSYDLWVGARYADPSLTGLLNCSLSPFDNEVHASNISGLEPRILLRHGGSDSNVPPENGRYLKEEIDTWARSSIQLDEVDGQDHWWPTVFRDRQDFVDQVYTAPLEPNSRPTVFTLTVANPQESGPKYGLRILEVEHTGRIARLQVRYVPETTTVELRSQNVMAVGLSPAAWQGILCMTMNGQAVELDSTASATSGLTVSKSAYSPSGWSTVYDGVDTTAVYPGGGLLQFLRTDRIVIVAARHGLHRAKVQLSMAYRISHMFYIFGGINSDVVWDDDVELDQLYQHANVVLLGSEDDNALLQKMARNFSLPADFKSRYMTVGSEMFNMPGTGVVALLPHPQSSDRLSLVVHGIDPEGLELCFNFIPCRTGTPWPDYVIFSPQIKWQSFGGILGAGFWTPRWSYDPVMSWSQD